MLRILFVCYGNICRSTMAEFVMKSKAEKAGLSDKIYVESAGTSDEEVGNPVYPGTRRALAKRGIDCSGKTARQTTRDDYRRFDYIVGMELANKLDLKRIYGGDALGKISLLLDYTDKPGDIDDPWYHRDFELTFRQIDAGCDGLLAELKKKLAVDVQPSETTPDKKNRRPET